jgi:hypothetical protein
MDPLRELADTARELCELRAVSRRPRFGSGWLRRSSAEVARLERRCTVLIDRWIADPELRRRWDTYVRGSGAEPELKPFEPLLFQGRSSGGSRLSVRLERNGECSVELDGAFSERLPEGQPLVVPFAYRGASFEEVFALPAAAVRALTDYVQSPSSEPPWGWARTLYEQGIIDGAFHLTERGHRLFGGLVRDSQSARASAGRVSGV